MDRIRCLSCAIITAVALSALLGCKTGPRGQTDAEPIAASALVGLWQGFAFLERQEIRVEIEISQNPEGELAGIADFRDSGSLGVPLEVDLADNTVILSTASGSLFEGRLLDDLRAIQGELFAATTDTWYSLILERDNEAFRRFDVPRLTDAGAVQRDYSYRPPRVAEDGWPVSNLDAEAIDERLLTPLELAAEIDQEKEKGDSE